MTTTEQRSGFRLPWASDPSADALKKAGPDAATDAASEVSAEAHDVNPASTPDEGTVPGDSRTISADPQAVPWPTSDASRGADVPNGTVPETPTDRPKPRPANPLVAGLIRVMREAAETARQEALAKFAEAVKARTEQIQTESATESAEIRRASEHDVAEIRDWSKVQTARLREETDQRIAARRRRLELDSEDHTARIKHRVEHVQGSVGAFETRMEAFFRTLLAEDDPALLAGFAEQLPEPPDLEDENDLADWAPSRTLDPDDAAAAEAAALSDLDLGDPYTDEDDESVPGSGATSPEASIVEGAPTLTHLSVVGLLSVASIAGFKRAVAKAAGIESVSVTSGPGGDFVFSVRHGATVDLGAVVGGLEEFSASVTKNKDGALSVTASEPADLG